MKELRQKWVVLCAAGVLGTGLLGLSGQVLAKAPPIDVGGSAIVSAYAKRQVLKVGMETTIVEHAAGIANQAKIELYDQNTGTYLQGDPLGGGAVGFVVASSSSQLVTYRPVVEYAGVVHLAAGPSIAVEWQSAANSTSNGFSAPNGGGANADFYTTGANSAAPTESVHIAAYDMASYGYNSEGFAEDYGGPVLQNWTDLSNGATNQSTYQWKVPTDGKPMFYQMTAYAVPKSNGQYQYDQQAKVYSPTFVANEPANPDAAIPEVAPLGTNLQLTGLHPGWAVWFTCIGMNTQDLKWETVAVNASGDAVIPLNRLGAVKILLNGQVDYVNVESAPTN